MWSGYVIVVMKHKFLAVFLSVLILGFLLVGIVFVPIDNEEKPDFFVGVDVAYADLLKVKEVIDEVCPYTNLFVIGSTGISHDQARLEEICEYLYDCGLYFIVYTHDPRVLPLIAEIEAMYPKHFLGVYFSDEEGGKQLDLYYEHRWVMEAENYTEAADKFVYGLNWWLTAKEIDSETFLYSPSDFSLFTSDYSLYWFDYLAGYDVVFAEFGWNYSRQLNVALNRGAATYLDKEWGVIVAWTTNHPPYIESGDDLYKDMVLAYDNGAKYVLVFDTNEDYTESILQTEHYEAMEKFWEYTQDNPRDGVKREKRVAFVLPEGYGYGFRGPNDKIWGIFNSTLLSLEMSHHLGSLLEEYGTSLDIIYGDKIETREEYSKYIFWNGIVVSD
jgi:hypothetical protein